MNATKLSDEVFLAQSPVVSVTKEDIQFLKARAIENPRGRCRLLLHQDVNDTLHEMVIVHTEGGYIRPHKNFTGDKSFSVVEGAFALVSFDEDGNVTGHQVVAAYPEGGVFTVRLTDSRYHTLVNLTPQVVFIETCLGPFKGSQYAPWAPEEGTPEAQDYHQKLWDLVAQAG